MINGPRIKKELDQLVTNSKLKEVMHEHAIEFMATDHKHKQEKQKAELEIMRAKGEHGKELLEERLRSREREIESRAEAYEMQFKVLDTEERLRQAVELEYTGFICTLIFN